ncbi:methyltransferase family protein [Streptomyces sp. DT224]|uniref:methyltransferase family protein n=1 Tax=unclassified Streptomyces TaxID=2593676 RepID=UPI0011CE5F09|nr:MULTISPECIES: isoprenylcysteine carboxylmethyltransferase family protein [unclassified Streptomyces]TXS38259.1 isoprenylcysteine carboxylmethyltransferase family protein [Streptomyces sp. or43]WRZ03567.1 isoprenylcysteine carboxylmethyltransferase family protein [Streptomyces sp. NBC_00385]
MNGWALTALTLYVAWTMTAFGVRGAMQQRRTGDTGFRGISGRPGSPPWWAGVLFVLALLGGAAAPVAALFGLPALSGDEMPAVRWAGLVIALAGIGATLMAQTNMGASWRVGVDAAERTDLVTTGLFTHVRNPVFTAMTATAVGLALMVPNVIAVIALGLLLFAIELQVRVVEEPYLSGVHGQAYGLYSARTGRFLPGVGRRQDA